MRYWMHGVGKDIPQSVQQLKQLGFEAVVDNHPETIEAANKVGLDVYLCSGAFGASGKFSDPAYLARDVNGQSQLWFGSTCPNQPEVRKENLVSIAKMAQTRGIKGILMDGARFASPASGSNMDAFYTCFCPVCAKKATDLGFDFIKMRTAVETISTHQQNQPWADLGETIQGLLDWLHFRRVCTTEHLLNFCDTVKTVSPGLLTGIYIFTPSLSWLVGQNYQDLRGKMDLFSPMIYRDYQAEQGPACLNFELSTLVQEMGKKLLSEQQAIALLAGLTGLPINNSAAAAELFDGLSPQVVGHEVRQARKQIGLSNQLIPIIQLDDDLLEESITEVKAAGTDGINFFVYQDSVMESKHSIFENGKTV